MPSDSFLARIRKENADSFAKRNQILEQHNKYEPLSIQYIDISSSDIPLNIQDQIEN